MKQNKYLPILVTGFAAGVLATVPLIKNFGFFLIVPVAAFLALELDIKINKAIPPLQTKNVILFGILTGITAAIFTTSLDVLLTFIAHTNDFVINLPQAQIAMRSLNMGALLDDTMGLFTKMANDITNNGFSLLYTIAIFFSNLLIDIIFGIIGAVIGKVVINKRK